jgi:hypothetical protein
MKIQMCAYPRMDQFWLLEEDVEPKRPDPSSAPPLWTCCYMQLRLSNNSETITTVRNLSGLLQTLSHPSNNCSKKKKKP